MCHLSGLQHSQTCFFDTSRSIKCTRSINKFACTKWKQHNKQSHELHFNVQSPPLRPARIQTTSPTHYDVLMHLVFPLVANEAKFTSYGIAIAICSSSLFIEEKKKPKALNVCMYNMWSWHWIKRIKQKNSRIKLSLKTEQQAVSNPSD